MTKNDKKVSDAKKELMNKVKEVFDKFDNEYNFSPFDDQDMKYFIKLSVIDQLFISLNIDKGFKPFTENQINFICSQIDDWYLSMKQLFEGQHNFGYMKERLKVIICEENNK